MDDVKTVVCRTLTIPGIGKIGYSPDRFIRFIWMAFVIAMSIVLIYFTTDLVQEFLRYEVDIGYSIIHNDMTTEFPSFTFCHYYPFWPYSEIYWTNKAIMSPTEFNNKLREKMKSNINSTWMIKHLFHDVDKLDAYYQHLALNESDKLGWDTITVFMCSVTRVNDFKIGLLDECSLKIRKISIPRFFNCFSVTPIDDDPNNRVTSVTLIIQLTDNVHILLNNSEHLKAFIPGVLDQFRGLRAMVHERFTFPDVEKEGFHIQPGKINEINVVVNKKKRIDTPKFKCTRGIRDKIVHLNKSYLFTEEACIKSLRGSYVLNECSCFLATAMMNGIPNETHPYCGNILELDSDIIQDRWRNVSLKIKEFDGQIEQIKKDQCKPRCEHYNYDFTMSETEFIPTDWRSDWMIIVHRDIEELYSKNFDVKKQKEVLFGTYFEKYLNSEDLFNSSKYTYSKDSYAMVVINKRNFQTKETSEIRRLNTNNFVSRLGGLCSLYLGLKFAFVIEIFELIYWGIKGIIKYSTLKSKISPSDELVIENTKEEIE